MDNLKELVIRAAEHAEGSRCSMLVNPHDILAIAEACWELEKRAEAAEAKLAQREKLDEEAMHCATILEFIGSFESDDIDGDFVDLRFEIDGEDVGCDVSITEYARMSAKAIRAIISGASVSLPAPAAVPVDLVPDLIKPEDVKSILDPTANPDEYACCVGSDLWNACCAEVLRRIEGLNNEAKLSADRTKS